MMEFVENLLEFNIVDRNPGEIGMWSSKGFETAKGVKGNWIVNGLAGHGITLDLNSVFKVINAPTNSPFIIIGGGTVEDVKAWTELSDGPEGTAIATIGWSKIRKGLFKELSKSSDIVWGKNTTALETAQCLGVYLDVDTAFADYKDDNAKGRATWIPKIEEKFNNGQDWNSAGVATLKEKMATMSDANFLQVLLHAKGVKVFVDQLGKNLGGSLHIIHGKIDDYYKAEEANFKLGSKGKKNTADFILANASAQEVIDAMNPDSTSHKNIKYKDAPLDYCYTDDGEKIKWYQISLKMAHGQLGKVTDTMKSIYFPGRTSVDLWHTIQGKTEDWAPIVKNYLAEQDYELNEWNSIMDIISKGVAAIKAASVEWYEKITGWVNKLKDWALGLSKSFESGMPTGKNPTAYQIRLLQKVLVEDGRLKHGQLLNEAKIDCDGINECLKTTNQAGAQKVVQETNRGIANIQGRFYPKDLMAFSGEGFVNEKSYTQDKKGKKSWTFSHIIKIFANATAVDAFNRMIKTDKTKLTTLVRDQIDLAREIYFGKTKLPLFKVFSAKTDTSTDTVERLGTADDWVKGKLEGLISPSDGLLGAWPVIGFSTTLQKGMYYNISGGLISGTDAKGKHPAYILLAMRTNRADAFSFVAEGSGTLNFTQFKKKFGIAG